MKKIIGVTLMLATLSSSGFAQTCRGSNCKVAGGSAAGMMVTGVLSIRGLIKAKDLENKYSVQIFGGAKGSTDEALKKIVDGDRVMVQHTRSKQANLQYHIDHLESQISSSESSAAMYASSIESDTNRLAYESNLTQQERWSIKSNIESNRMLMANALAEARASERELMKVHAGKAEIPVYKFDKYLKKSNMNLVGDYVRGLSADGSRVVYMNRLPGAIAKKVASGARNGWILAATAVAFGLVTAEELASGAIARKLDGETRSMQNGNY